MATLKGANSRAADFINIVELRKGAEEEPAGVSAMDLESDYKEKPLPFAKLLGIELVSLQPDRVVGEMTVRENLCTSPAVAHGGAIMAFADTLGALATVANLPEGRSTTTIESKTNFLRAAPLGVKISGETTPVHRGSRTMVWQTRIVSANGELVALVTQTQLII